MILLFTPKFSHQLFCSTWPHMISLRIFAKHYRRSWKTACIFHTLHPITILIHYRISSTLILLKILITNLLSSGKRGKIITWIMKNNGRSWSQTSRKTHWTSRHNPNSANRLSPSTSKHTRKPTSQ